MTFAFILIIIVCIFLILIVLVQNSKGGGLASGFTGSQVMGVRKTADFLEKATWTLATVLIVFCLVVNMILPRHSSAAQKSLMQQESAPVNTTTSPRIPNPKASNEVPVPAPAQDQNSTEKK